MISLNTEERNMILIQGLDFFAASLSGIFITVFLFINSDLRTTLFYIIIMNLAFLFFYMASGWSFKKIQSGTLIRISLGTSTLFFFFLFLLKENAIQYLIPLAILSGSSGGIYWAAFNLNQYAFSNKESRIKYFGWSSAVLNAFQAIAPILGGAIIAVTGNLLLFGVNVGYSILFLIVSMIFLLMLFLFNKLPEHKLISFSLKHIIEHKRSKVWINVLCQQFFFGMYDVVYGTMLGILIFLIVKGEFLLGTVQTLGFAACAIGSIFAIKLLHKYRQGYWVGILGQSVGIIIFALNQNLIGIIVYILSGLVTPLLNTKLSTVTFHSMDMDSRHISEKYYLLAEQVFILLSARILSNIFLFIIIGYGDQILLAKQFLFILPIFPILIGLLLTKYDKVSSNLNENINNPMS